MIYWYLHIDVRKILMNKIIKSATKVLMFIILFSLAGCGVKSNPSQPKNSLYPGHYPKQNKTVEVEQRKQGRSLNRNSNAFYQYPNRLK